MQKMKIDYVHCPEEVLEAIIKAVWTEQCVNL